MPSWYGCHDQRLLLSLRTLLAFKQRRSCSRLSKQGQRRQLAMRVDQGCCLTPRRLSCSGSREGRALNALQVIPVELRL